MNTVGLVAASGSAVIRSSYICRVLLRIRPVGTTAAPALWLSSESLLFFILYHHQAFQAWSSFQVYVLAFILHSLFSEDASGSCLDY